MSNALKKIITRAKQLHKKYPGKKWKTVVKDASAEYRGGKLGATKKKKVYQTGKSHKKRDSMRKAKRPGKRTSRAGNSYTERRKNRTDMPHSVTGMKATAREELSKALLAYELADTVKATKAAQKRKLKWRKIVKAL